MTRAPFAQSARNAQQLDLGDASIVAFGATIGTLAGGTAARLLRLTPDDVSRWTLDGSFVGGAIASFLWLIASITPYLR